MASYKIVSFDVGIKNLAFCLLEKVGPNISIKKWDIINLIDSDKIVCEVEQKNKKVCGKKATYCSTDDDEVIHYYCKTHKSAYQPLEAGWQDTYMQPIKETAYSGSKIQTKLLHQSQFEIGEPAKTKAKEKTVEKITCDFVLPKKNSKCGKKAGFTCEDSNYCLQHKTSIIKQREKDFSVKLVKKVKCNATDNKMIALKMYEKLDAIPDLLQVDEVLIENQPSLKNPIMKTIACLLFSYFVLRGLTDKVETGSTINHVRFYSPSNKLKVNDDKTFEIINSTKQKAENKIEPNAKKTKKKTTTVATTNVVIDEEDEEDEEEEETAKSKTKKDSEKYKLTKELSIKYAKILLSNEKIWLDHLATYTKKDDMTDSYLQGYYYLIKNK